VANACKRLHTSRRTHDESRHVPAVINKFTINSGAANEHSTGATGWFGACFWRIARVIGVSVHNCPTVGRLYLCQRRCGRWRAL